MKKKYLLIVHLTSLFSSVAYSQATLYFEYDLAGNRVSRSYIRLRSTLQEIDTLSFEHQIEKEGISKSLVDCKVAVYPNPTHGEVHVSITHGDNDALSEVTVFSSSGQWLFFQKVHGNTTIPIDLSPFPDGLYLINFQCGESRSYYKIIKQ